MLAISVGVLGATFSDEIPRVRKAEVPSELVPTTRPVVFSVSVRCTLPVAQAYHSMLPLAEVRPVWRMSPDAVFALLRTANCVNELVSVPEAATETNVSLEPSNRITGLPPTTPVRSVGFLAVVAWVTWFPVPEASSQAPDRKSVV